MLFHLFALVACWFACCLFVLVGYFGWICFVDLLLLAYVWFFVLSAVLLSVIACWCFCCLFCWCVVLFQLCCYIGYFLFVLFTVVVVLVVLRWSLDVSACVCLLASLLADMFVWVSLLRRTLLGSFGCFLCLLFVVALRLLDVCCVLLLYLGFDDVVCLCVWLLFVYAFYVCFFCMLALLVSFGLFVLVS